MRGSEVRDINQSPPHPSQASLGPSIGSVMPPAGPEQRGALFTQCSSPTRGEGRGAPQCVNPVAFGGGIGVGQCRIVSAQLTIGSSGYHVRESAPQGLCKANEDVRSQSFLASQVREVIWGNHSRMKGIAWVNGNSATMPGDCGGHFIFVI